MRSVCCTGEAQAPQAEVLDTARVVSLLAKSGKTNGTRSGESNSKVSVLIGGANAFASSTTDGTGQLGQLSYLPNVCSVCPSRLKSSLRQLRITCCQDCAQLAAPSEHDHDSQKGQ